MASGMLSKKLNNMDETGGGGQGTNNRKYSLKNRTIGNRYIEKEINGVKIKYLCRKVRIDPRLSTMIEEGVAYVKEMYPDIDSITISDLFRDSKNSIAHFKYAAADISRVNDVRMGTGFKTNLLVNSVTKELQKFFL